MACIAVYCSRELFPIPVTRGLYSLLSRRLRFTSNAREWSVIVRSPRKATENKEQVTNAVCRVFAYHSNAYALSTLARTHAFTGVRSEAQSTVSMTEPMASAA